jgi:hypothetical protein
MPRGGGPSRNLQIWDSRALTPAAGNSLCSSPFHPIVSLTCLSLCVVPIVHLFSG